MSAAERNVGVTRDRNVSLTAKGGRLMFVAMGRPVSGSRTTTKLANTWVDELVEALTSYQPTKPGAVSSVRGAWLLLMSTLNNWARVSGAKSRTANGKTGKRQRHFITL